MSSMADPPSPWKHPEEVNRLRQLRKKKLALQARLTGLLRSSSSPSEPSSSPAPQKKFIIKKRSRNPFSAPDANDAKKPCLEPPPELDPSADVTLFQLLTSSYGSPSTSGELVTSFSDVFAKESSCHSDASKDDDAGWEEELPIDWSLKTSLRFTSSLPFPWDPKLKACEEASGVSMFTRCLPSNDCSSASLDTSPAAHLRRCSFYWQHPAKSGVNLFPRYRTRGLKGADSSGGGSKAAPSQSDQEAMHKDWKESLTSLYQLLRTRQCPFFYLCAPAFTCLFRAAGMSSALEINAILTPSTSGLRNSMKREGIEFSMPLKKESPTKRNSDEEPAVDDSPKKGGTEDEETLDLLASMGANQTSLVGLSIRDRIRREGGIKDDFRPESAVQVNGVETQSLLDFLLSSRSCIAASGHTAGIPPTLLAPVAFQGATLMKLQVHYSTIQAGTGSSYVVELRGPILPHVVHEMMDSTLRNVTLSTITSVTCQGSEAFARLPDRPSSSESGAESDAFGLVNLSDCGLGDLLLQRFCGRDTKCQKEVVEIQCKDKVFRWK